MSLDQSNIIDALGIDETTGRVTLIILHDTPWEGTPAQLYLLQEKLNVYLSFALDGEMEAEYPAFAGKPLRLRIDCASAPDPGTLHMLGHVRQQLQFQDIDLVVRITTPGEAPESGPSHGCGGGCHCH
jgi:hypothetical protein